MVSELDKISNEKAAFRRYREKIAKKIAEKEGKPPGARSVDDFAKEQMAWRKESYDKRDLLKEERAV